MNDFLPSGLIGKRQGKQHNLTRRNCNYRKLKAKQQVPHVIVTCMQKVLLIITVTSTCHFYLGRASLAGMPLVCLFSNRVAEGHF